MYIISKQEWKAMEKTGYTGIALTEHEHNGKICKVGDETAMQSLFTKRPNNGLLFEHIHFEIVENLPENTKRFDLIRKAWNGLQEKVSCTLFNREDAEKLLEICKTELFDYYIVERTI